MFASHPLKRLGFLKLGDPQLGHRPTVHTASIWTSSTLPHGTWEQGGPTWTRSSCLLCAVSNKVLCLPRVLCLVSASMKLWRARLVCKQSKVSDAFLTPFALKESRRQILRTRHFARYFDKHFISMNSNNNPLKFYYYYHYYC